MIYSVQRGDTMSSIAARNNTSLQSLEKANPQISDPNVITTQDKLNIPGSQDEFQDPAAQAPTNISGASAPASAASGTQSGQDVVNKAESLMGTPYNYAGMYDGTDTPGQLHCAELTSAAYGGKISDSVYDQQAMLSTNPGTGAPGDIAVFGDSGYGVPHVGIVTGRGTVIHASAAAGEVVETPIDQIPAFEGYVRP